MIKNNQGFIALTSVLILSAIFLLISISVASRGISGFGTSVAFNQRDTAKYLASACIEYAHMELQRTLDYRGNESIIMDDGTCQILDIKGSGNTDRILQVQSTVGEHTYRIEDIIETVSPNMLVTSSKRVTNF